MKLALVDHAPGLEQLFAAPPPAFDAVVAIDGEMPAYLRGSYYAIGPGRFAVGDVRYRHWLDGDGVVLAVHVGARREARVVSRFVAGTKQRDESAAGSALYRAFGTAFAGDRLRRGLGLESPLNVSIHTWQGQLLAYGEQALPWRLDPLSLETLGEHDFGCLSPASPLSAHPSLDGVTGELANFGIGFSPARPTLTYYRFTAAGDLALRRRHVIDHPVSVHDFARSKHFAVFDLSPYVLDFEAFRDGASLFEALTWKPELGRVLLILDRLSGDEVARVPLPGGYCLHLVDAWEDGATLVVDLIEQDEPVYDQYLLPELFPEARGASAVRYRIDPAAARMLRRAALGSDLMCDFPVTDPRCAGHGCSGFFASAISGSHRPGRKFFDRLVRFAWDGDGVVDAWQAAAGTYLGGEAGFVPDPDHPEGGAVILPVVSPETTTSRVLVFDARALEDGPVATLSLPVMLSPLFHAWYAARQEVPTDL